MALASVSNNYLGRITPGLSFSNFVRNDRGLDGLSSDEFFVTKPRLMLTQNLKDPCKYEGLYHDPGCGAVVSIFLLVSMLSNSGCYNGNVCVEI